MNTYSLVLWWGWSRWLAHIWVLKALEEKQVKINEIVGTSMGAIVWAAYVTGLSRKEIYDFWKATKMRKIADIRFGKISVREWMVHGNKALQMMQKLYQNKYFSETDIPLSVVVTDVSTWAAKIISDGSIADAVRASSSFPWVFSSHSYGGKEYLDGWLCVNLPVNYASSKSVIVSSTLWPADWFADATWTLWELESIMAIMLKQQEDRDIEKFSWDLILIRPDISHIKTFDFSHGDFLIEQWYQATLEQLKNL